MPVDANSIVTELEEMKQAIIKVCTDRGWDPYSLDETQLKTVMAVITDEKVDLVDDVVKTLLQ